MPLHRALAHLKIAFEIAFQGGYIDLGDAARLAIRLAGKNACLAPERANRSRICRELLQHLPRHVLIRQHGVEVHHPQGGLGIGEDIAEADRNLLPLLLQSRIGIEPLADRICDGILEPGNAGDHGPRLLA
ncbi:hypothetical protein D3C87_1584410 [compost metagenome]